MEENDNKQNEQTSIAISGGDEWRAEHGFAPHGENFVAKHMSDYIQNGDYKKEKNKWRGKEI